MTKINVKSELQTIALATLQTYLTAHPEQARALCESCFIDLCRKLTITETEAWIDELDHMIAIDGLWETEES